MLKVCLDCIAGSSSDTENTYHPTRNENFHSVQWTSRNPGNMIRLPRPMNYNDSIEINGEILRRESIMFSFCHENSSSACKIEFNFIDKCTYECKDGNKNVISDIDPAKIFKESNFTLALTVENQTDDGEYVLGVSIKPYDLHSFIVNNISSLSYLEISNDVSVKMLCFKY